MAGIPPQQTLYINNLNDKLHKDELKRNLYLLFSQYGPLMDVVCSKVYRMRGQGFVAFKDINSATTAMRQLQGYFFFEKPLRIQYSRNKADVVARLDGTYSAKKKRERKEKEKEREREKERLRQKRKESVITDRSDREAKRRKQEEEAQTRDRVASLMTVVPVRPAD
eukprot:NODE_5888_length_597_cov_45.425532_g5723_i0.p1 GENE.NODE_5888_length_597_cov_45.425532_g5723_i0~~NODE_5888_length_597_cov_45.425532_g5723_i0.p1  ORF type:complete len:167 (+),score=59.73 NODE_5888_length_597_cov_45.425532_g5723_i0:61-561(+)